MRDQVELYERTDGQQGNTLRDTGLPVVIFTMRGRKSGKIRKVPLMRVEHDGRVRDGRLAGRCAETSGLVSQRQGRPRRSRRSRTGRSASTRTPASSTGEERAEWWERAVAAYPPYADYQRKTDRLIPVLLAERRS